MLQDEGLLGLDDLPPRLLFKANYRNPQGMTHMKSSIKAAVGAALLGAFSMSAFATSVTPPSAGPTPNPGSVAGGLIAYVYDQTAGTALVEWLGGDTTTFGAPSATPAGGETLDYGILGGSTLFGSLFSSADVTAGAVKFSVMSVNDVVTTSPVVDLTQSGTPATLRLNALELDAQNAVTGVGSIMNSASACNNANPCTGNTPTSPVVTGVSDFTAAGSVGVAGTSALAFYQVTGTGSAATTQTFVPFANATGAATWALSGAGDLVYTVPSPSAVPVPAALWLFGSGLLGFGGIARRKARAA